MPAALGQASKGSTASATSVATGTMATSASGSLMVGAMVFQGTFSAYTDNKLNSPYVQVDSERIVDTPNTAKLRMYYFQNALGGSGHTTTAATTTAQPITNCAAEFTGMLTVGALDTNNGGNDASSPFGNAVSITPTAGRRVLVAAFGGNSGSNPAAQAETQGFTVIASTQETNGATFWTACLAYRIVTADGSTAYTAQFTEGGASEGGVILAAFKEANSGVGARLSNARTRTGPYRFRKPTLAYVDAAPANLSLAIDVNGAITLAGQSATFNLGLAQTTQGAITIAGQTVTPALTIPVSNGAVTIAGQSVTFARNVALSANGAITIAGQSVTPALTVPVTNGAVTLAGQSATFALSAAVSNGAITFNGQTVALDLAGNLTLSIDTAGLITLAGQLVDLTAPAAPTTTTETFSGGLFYEFEINRRRRQRMREEQALREAESEQIQSQLDRSIAELLREQERKDAERAELSRLQALADRYAGQGMKAGLSRDASLALLKAHEERSRNALEQLQRLIERQLEEEEVAIVSLLLLDD